MERSQSEQRELQHERKALLYQVSSFLEFPMIVLAFVWLALLIVELTGGLSRTLERVGLGIWVLFLLHFLLEFWIAPSKFAYLRRNWLTAVALFIPALRVFRIARAFRILRLARTVRGLRLARVLTSLRRSMRSLGSVMGRRGFGYVVLLTLLVTLAGAAGMYTFERAPIDGKGFKDFGAALWWTAMIMTTMGSEYWPQTPEGRILCLLLSIYSFAIFGYVAATIASYFIDSDAANKRSALAGSQAIEELKREVAALRKELRQRE